jgi:hypothetical protein
VPGEGGHAMHRTALQDAGVEAAKRLWGPWEVAHLILLGKVSRSAHIYLEIRTGSFSWKRVMDALT